MAFKSMTYTPDTWGTCETYRISGHTALVWGITKHISSINPYHSTGYPHGKNFFQLKGMDVHQSICNAFRVSGWDTVKYRSGIKKQVGFKCIGSRLLDLCHLTGTSATSQHFGQCQVNDTSKRNSIQGGIEFGSECATANTILVFDTNSKIWRLLSPSFGPYLSPNAMIPLFMARASWSSPLKLESEMTYSFHGYLTFL